MKHLSFTFLVTTAAMALLGNISYGQYTVTGSTPGGGKIIVGNGTLGALGPGSPLSAGGNDQITINAGAIATGTLNTIVINSTSDIFTNNGTVNGAGNGGYGVSWNTSDNPSLNSSFTNNGTLQGANATTASHSGGDGVDMELTSNNGNATTTFINNGMAIGGNGGSSSGKGGRGIDYETYPNDTTGLGMATFINNGTVRGGSGAYGQEGIYFEVDGGTNLVGNFTNNNAIFGGNGTKNSAGYSSADVEMYSGGAATGNFTNNGLIQGGFFGSNASNTNTGGEGVYFEVDGHTTVNTTFINNGNILGGSNLNTDVSSGAGVEYYSGRNNGSGQKPNVTVDIINNGTIIAPQGKGGKQGIYFNSYNTSSLNLTITNNVGGMISGGNAGSATSGGGNGIYLDNLRAANDVNGVIGRINNYGTIKGGNGSAGQSSGAAIDIFAENITINNYGTLSPGAGNNPHAIVISGNNNTVNLLGHSVTNGIVMATGTGNVLNVKLTGFTPAQIAQLRTEFAPYLTGSPTANLTGIPITSRGFSVSWDPLIVNLNLQSYQLQGLTPNQKSVGASLDSLNGQASTQLLALFNTIDSSGNVPLALEQLSPQRYQMFGDIALSNANQLTLEVDNRLNNLRDGSESVDTTGMGGDTDKAVAGYSKDGKTVVAPESMMKARRWGFFASATGSFANIDGEADVQKSDFNSVGVISGVDGKIGENALVGVLMGYDNTSASLDSQGSNAKVESYSTGLYGSYHQDGFYTNSLLAYTRNNYTTARTISFPGFASTASGGSHGNQYTVNIDGGYDHHVSNRLTVGPIAGLQYVHLDTDSFNESGAGAANLAIGGQSVESLRSRFGARADYHLQVDKDLALGIEVRAAWQHEFLNDSRSISASFAGGQLSSFTVQTTKPHRDAVLAGAGINATISDRFTVYVDYDAQAASNYIEHSFKGGLKISF